MLALVFSLPVCIWVHIGLITGHKMIGVRMVLQDGASHSVDSSELAFRLAAVGAMRQSFPLATPTVLEPIMSVEVVAPDEFQVCGREREREGGREREREREYV